MSGADKGTGLQTVQTDPGPMTDQDKADFKKELDGKSLADAMALEKDLRKRHDEEEEALKRFLKGGNKDELQPYAQQHQSITIEQADFDKMNAMIQKDGLKNEKAAKSIKPGEDPEKARQAEQAWLDKTFQGEKIETFLMKGKDGKDYIAIVGESPDAIIAARDIEKNQTKADMTHESVQQKISTGMQQTTTKTNQSVTTPPITPGHAKPGQGLAMP